MSGIYIPNMEIPKSCKECIRMGISSCPMKEEPVIVEGCEKPLNCPLVEVPTPHGDIKDTKDILNRLALKPTYDAVSTLLSIQAAVDESPIIIEASN